MNADAFVKAIKAEGMEQKVRVLETGKGVVIRFRDDVLFESGSAELRPEAAPVIRRIADVLRSLEAYQLLVEGYADTQPISTARFPSNWELSAARALSVVRAFIATGVRPEDLAAIGYGEYHPVASNDTPAGRAENRRVEIVVSRIPERSGP